MTKPQDVQRLATRGYEVRPAMNGGFALFHGNANTAGFGEFHAFTNEKDLLSNAEGGE